MAEGLAEGKARDGDSGPPVTAPQAPEALPWLRTDQGWVRESSSQWAEGSRQPGTPLSLPEKCQAAWSVALQRRVIPRGDRRGHRKGPMVQRAGAQKMGMSSRFRDLCGGKMFPGNILRLWEPKKRDHNPQTALWRPE